MMDTRTTPASNGPYPSLSPDASGWLEVGGDHEIYWETCGNPDGKPALFLHGGPGGSCHPDHRRLFDPKIYRIVLFDQRGSGRSRPRASIDDNTTSHLVADIETLRQHLEIDDWLILGGSWGAALALAYAQAHNNRVRAIVLRGVFTARQKEINWLYRFGASELFPDEWNKFSTHVPPDERHDLVSAYHRRLMHEDENVQKAAARHWCGWESALLTLKPRGARTFAPTPGEVALARIEAHYFINNTFMREAQILNNMDSIAHIPGIAVQGRYDVITPVRTAYDLCEAWSNCKLVIVPDAGHATSETGIIAALVEATDGFRGV